MPSPSHWWPLKRQRHADTISMEFLCPINQLTETLWNILRIPYAEVEERKYALNDYFTIFIRNDGIELWWQSRSTHGHSRSLMTWIRRYLCIRNEWSSALNFYFLVAHFTISCHYQGMSVWVHFNAKYSCLHESTISVVNFLKTVEHNNFQWHFILKISKTTRNPSWRQTQFEQLKHLCYRRFFVWYIDHFIPHDEHTEVVKFVSHNSLVIKIAHTNIPLLANIL